MIVETTDGELPIPRHVLRQVLNCSPDGYYLFYMAADGEPVYLSSVRNSVLGRAFVQFLEEKLEKKQFKDKKSSAAFKDSLSLAGLEEHTAGGFLLIYKKQDGDKDIDYILNTDDKAIKRGILSFVEDIVSGLRFVEQNEYAGHFFNGLEDSGDESLTED